MIEELKNSLSYEPNTGRLTWMKRITPINERCSQQQKAAIVKFNKYFAGKYADELIDRDGYRRISFRNKKLRAHRVAWAIFYGEWPSDQIDHISGVYSDNRISNMRDVGYFDNSRNKKVLSNNTSGTTGVRWHRAAKKWCASIKSNRLSIHLGLFENINDAIAVRKKAEREMGFHANHGRLRSGLAKLPEQQNDPQNRNAQIKILGCRMVPTAGRPRRTPFLLGPPMARHHVDDDYYGDAVSGRAVYRYRIACD